ncbi:MAG: hypothetical protein PF795_08475 [Kiritimatiellae bacterium]|jgi:hypothetical protein|nr:hypothetical protein [Kiritimatiellia bacterium]
MSLNRAQKVKKLANAIKDYRGKKHPVSNVWVVRPKPAARRRVEHWLGELGLDTVEGMRDIDGFKTFPEFHEWLRGLRAVDNSFLNH